MDQICPYEGISACKENRKKPSCKMVKNQEVWELKWNSGIPMLSLSHIKDCKENHGIYRYTIFMFNALKSNDGIVKYNGNVL